MKKLGKTKRVICVNCKRRFAVSVNENPPYLCGGCKNHLKQESK